MNKLKSLLSATLHFAIAAICVACVQASRADEVDYSRDVYPILEKYCVACHTEDEAQGGLVMTSFDAFAIGGESGPAFTPGSLASSRMYLMAAKQLEPIMPPDDAEGPNEVELQTIATWIEQGAKGPQGSVAMKRELNTPKIVMSESATLPITAIALSPDGATRAVCRYSDVRIVVGDDALPITVLEQQPGKVNSIEFSRDGKTVLVGSGVTGLGGRAAIYDLATGDVRIAFEGHDDAIQTAIFSPDEKHVATASYDRQILLWEIASGKVKQRFIGHNGAIYSLAFSPDGRVLLSGCADETVKAWNVDTGERLDTMGQSTGEVFCVAVTHDGGHVVAGSADNRLRVWQLRSRDIAETNPLVATRFVDESPLTHMAFTADGSRLVILSEAGNIKVIDTNDWSQTASLEPLGETASDLAISADGSEVMISLMNGVIAKRFLGESATQTKLASPEDTTQLAPIYLDLGAVKTFTENEAATSREQPFAMPRGGEVTGKVASTGEEDWFAFDAYAGEQWVIETDTKSLASKLDSIIELYDETGAPVRQTRLQATRDSYFTFRGKNSTQNDDFRLFAWEEMKLNEYLYASGEVTRLWLAPRGADSGFNVYPGDGNRWTYFGTTGTVHALGELAYVVRPLADHEAPAANGLPVFDVFYANDDAPSQDRGKDSYVMFSAPSSGRYSVRLRDTRGEGGDGFAYKLRVRPAVPSFSASVVPIQAALRRGAGREVKVMIDRIDGFDDAVTFHLSDLPAGIHSNFPVRIQPGQNFAIGNIWADDDAKAWDGDVSPEVTAKANILDKQIERVAGVAGALKLTDRPSATLKIVIESVVDDASQNVVRIKRGETIRLIVKADRADKFTREISLGTEQAGRNLPHGVYVDNIGLNGLLVRENESERQFFVTANDVAELGVRSFFLTGAIDENITSPPVVLEVIE